MNELTIPSLSIGAIVGGETPSNMLWAPHIADLRNATANISSRISTSPRLNVVLQIPGPFLVPEFAGVVAGSYSRKDQVLGVMAALPESPPSDGYEQLTTLLFEAVQLAIATCVKRRIGHNLDSLLEAVSELQEGD